MKKVLILWWDGMLWNCLKKFFVQKKIEVQSTSRWWENNNIKFEINSDVINQLQKLLSVNNFNYVINCIGDLKCENSYDAFYINSYFPHILYQIADAYSIKVIHVSTNWVFSWKKWKYKPNDIPDELSLYWISKYLWESFYSPHIIIRTSVIGIGGSWWILERFSNLPEKSEVVGYPNVLWNWVTTLTLSKIMFEIINNDLPINGIMHITSDIISKLDLISLINEIYNKKFNILIDDSKIENKTLFASSFQVKYFQKILKPIKEQVKELKKFYKI